MIGAENLAKPHVAKAIREREARTTRPTIMSRKKRQEFLTEVIQDDSHEIRHRLKALELLSRINGDFLDRVSVEETVTVRMGALFDPEARSRVLAQVARSGQFSDIVEMARAQKDQQDGVEDDDMPVYVPDERDDARPDDSQTRPFYSPDDE